MCAGAPPRAGATVALAFRPVSSITLTGSAEIFSTFSISCWTSGANGMGKIDGWTGGKEAMAAGES